MATYTETHERYVREWLEQQTVAGILKVDDENADARKRKYRLPAGHAEVLVERDSLNYLAPLSNRDAGDPSLRGRYDLVTAFECVHDISDPIAVLRTMLELAGDGGTVIIMDERVGDSFTAKGNDVEWMMYGWSVLHCLPVGKDDRQSAETGTVMRAATLKRFAEKAGFCDVEVLPIDNFFFRFHRLNPVCHL